MTQALRYGGLASQSGVLHRPASGSRWPVVCLLHGGWWRTPCGPDQMEHLATDLARVAVVGHSAGGHLALCAGARSGAAIGFAPAKVVPAVVCGLAAVADLEQAFALGLGDDVVPAHMSRAYARAARDVGDRVDCIELPGTHHMEYLDPGSQAHARL